MTAYFPAGSLSGLHWLVDVLVCLVRYLDLMACFFGRFPDLFVLPKRSFF
jgi:hypothetical protein